MNIIMDMLSVNYNRGNFYKLIKLGKPHFAIFLFFYFSIGALLAVLFDAQFVLTKFILGYAIIFFSTWAIHYHNDYFDFKADHYVTPTPISGGSGVLIEHPEWRSLSKKIGITFIGLSIIIAAILTVFYSYTVWLFVYVIFSNFLAWFYAAPPVKLSYRGLGEFGNTAIGLLFPGLGYFVLMGTIDISFVIFVVPLVFLQLLFTCSVEIPDMEGDRSAGKMTWIATRGRNFGFKLIMISGLLATLIFFILSFTNLFPPIIDFRILTLISLIPLSLGIIEVIKMPLNKESATKFCIYNLAAILLTLILINCYLLYVI
jgi:1,4-dihydroxy-2-naphthoate octaprenyltransferase